MAGVFKRKSDRARKGGGKYTAWWIAEDGHKRSRVAYTDKAESKKLAERLELEARQIRDGLVEPGARTRHEASLKPLADHVRDYRFGLLAKGDKPRHAQHMAGAVRRVLDDAAIVSVAEIAPDRVQEALGRLRARGSPRTANHALAAIKAFVRWLEHSNRIREIPRGLMALTPYSEQVGRVRVRRALSKDELARLLAAAESGAAVHVYGSTRSKLHKVAITGPERATLYRLAMGTGFRANELRSLTPESFRLEGPEPSVTVAAAYSKRGRDDVQPIRTDLAVVLQRFLAGKEPGRRVLTVPDRTAQMLRVDLAAAGIPYRSAAGVVDFHALRNSYITHLVQDGVSPKTVQKLARHSTITLTLDRYCRVDDGDLRAALEKGES